MFDDMFKWWTNHLPHILWPWAYETEGFWTYWYEKLFG